MTTYPGTPEAAKYKLAWLSARRRARHFESYMNVRVEWRDKVMTTATAERDEARKALTGAEERVRATIASEIEAGRHARCAAGDRMPCSVCWALGEVARNVRQGAS